MNSSEIFQLITRYHRKFTGFLRSLNDQYGLEWLLVLVVAIAIIVFLIREKPVTNLLVWLSKHLWVGLKKFGRWLARLFSKIKLPVLSPKLKKIADGLDELSSSNFGRYDRPHYVVLNYGSDVSALMAGANDHDADTLNLENSQTSETGGRNWYLFNKGCIFDFPDAVKVSYELQQIRPERPLDGVLICVSAKTLKQATSEELNKQADKFYQQLWKLQAKFHFVLPVYLVISECEHIDGFREYWQFNPLSRYKDGIFGWSNPNDKLKPFDPNWVGQAMQSMTEQLRGILLNFVADGSFKASLETILFPSRFLQLKKPIGAFCQTLFASSSFHENFMFRGFYFSGNVEPESEHQGENNLKPQPWFLRDLFYKRIFAEANLAYAPQQKVFSSDRRLRIYQYAFLAVFCVLGIWFYLQQSQLAAHTENLVQKVHTLPTKHSFDGSTETGSDIRYVVEVLEHIALMDASNLQYGSIPWSYLSPMETRLSSYFARNIFGDIVFPAMECSADGRIEQRFNNPPAEQHFADWLAQLANDFRLHAQLNSLMKTTFSTSTHQIEADFSYLVEELFDQKLPASFYQRSQIYMDAISRYTYVPDLQECETEPLDSTRIWREIVNVANLQIDNIAAEVAAPAAFFTRVTELESLPVDTEWYQAQGLFVKELNEYLNWSTDLKTFWLKGHPQSNTCARSRDSLTTLSKFIHGDIKPFVASFYQDCMRQASAQLSADNDLLQPSLYQDISETQTMLSAEGQRLLSSISMISNLSFIQEEQARPKEIFDQEDFFWSIEGLNRALRMYEEYKAFALAHYVNVALPLRNPENNYNYVAQAVALKQLQLAMVNTISGARINENDQYFPDRYRPVNQQEAKLASYITNFNAASEALLKINGIFSELGFSESHKWLLDIANNHAFGLLKKVDGLYTNSHIYQPRDTVLWGAHQYVNAMFGIGSAGQLQDYLAAQAERVDYLTANYVEPILVFLRSTQARYVNYKMFSVWNNTLIELNKKQQNKDSATSQGLLEDFFNNQLLNTNQSNCFEQEKNFVVPHANDHFAISQRDIIEQAKGLCRSYTAEQIEKEYQQVFELFSSALANKYPFTSSPLARNVSPAEVKTFIEQYPGKSSGLAKRMDILVWSKRDSKLQSNYQKASEFVQHLDQAIDFFASVLDASDTGIELSLEFDVLKEDSKQVEHISRWQFNAGRESLEYPLTSGDNMQSILWGPNQEVSLNLDWAENSPFDATAQNGVNKGNQLVYGSGGFWSLLRFIERYRSGLTDTHKLIDESILLNFSAQLSSKHQGQSKTPDALAIARLTLFGQDAETKQQIPLNIPDQFPDFAPKLGGKS